ncbi:class I SAM-dependent DNA methyltransferase [Deinococcus sp. JMULE3]|uniref:class I SAM-dependent DNA methyltransferase n=1 Tax=Deinococcus sp. JMULE3 TaxID=2518341 RepID=UPI0015754DDF|nr:class I SAM-dependent DNA methyltransferase [Deinococcus sp. JMULE3]
MHPQEFAAKWRTRAFEVTEEQAYQEHYADVASLVGGPVPGQAGAPAGLTYQAGVSKIGSKDFGKADVFLPRHFIWEAKRAQKTADARARKLGDALAQASLYAYELGNPPLMIVTDFVEIRVHTVFTATAPRMYRITLDDIEQNRKLEATDLTALQVLHAAFHRPELLNPARQRQEMTTQATEQVGEVAQSMVRRGLGQLEVSHFLMRLVFAMFAEDVGLLDDTPLTRVLKRSAEHPERSRGYLEELFGAMQTGGEFWGADVRHFNGGLFDSDRALDLTAAEAHALLGAARLNWSKVEPAIFGTLFEHSLDSGTRGKRGAHYTPVQDILDVTVPVVLEPLRAEWDAVKDNVRTLLGGKAKDRLQKATGALQAFHQRLAGVTVLDPACGSGNFLVVTLRHLLDLESEVIGLAREIGAPFVLFPSRITPQQLRGIEVEPFAHELASVSVWIAFLQWKAAHPSDEWPTPILRNYGSIQHMDAVFDEKTGKEPEWPAAEFIVGNPPFLGNTRMRQRLGDAYTEGLRAAYEGRVPGFADFVMYWFEKARAEIQAGRTRRAGLIATNSIRGGANAAVLQRLQETGGIFLAWPDRAWVQDGAAVRVSVVGFDDGTQQARTTHWHDGDEADLTSRVTRSQPVAAFNADLTSGVDVRQARRLSENAGLSFEGVKPAGKFDLPGAVAREWLDLPNPTGVSNRDVLKPYVTGEDVMDRSKDRWTVDFAQMVLEQAEQYRRPMQHVTEHVKPVREKNNRAVYRQKWWIYSEARPNMREALKPLERFIGTSRVAKHRVFVWLPTSVVPSDLVTVIASDQDYMFGVLNSGIHVAWATRLGTSLEDRPRYTPTTTFETFPFPQPSPERREKIEAAARYLEQARAYLHGKDAPGRKGGVKLGLTDMYNLLTEYRVTRVEAVAGLSTLADAHEMLDQAVAAAYGWDWPLSEDDVLARLLALNLERAAATA